MEGKINYRDWVGGALIGGSIGLLGGFLMAPKSGKEIRTDLKGEAKELYSNTQARTGEILEKARQKAGDQVCQARTKIKEIVGGRSRSSERSAEDSESTKEAFGEA